MAAYSVATLAVFSAIAHASSPDGGAVNDGGAPCPSGMIRIPPATVTLGHDQNGGWANKVHVATIAAFCIDRTEVTVTSFRRVTRGPSPGGQCASGATEPMNCATYAEAKSFCASLGMRLPTSDEWEYAARGVDRRLSPTGGAMVVPSALSLLAVHNVGADAKDVSPFGLVDLAGNAPEWVDDKGICSAGPVGPDRYASRGGSVAPSLVAINCFVPQMMSGFRCAM
jgi:formylglycine-generating enzyme required for sulfatase activity